MQTYVFFILRCQLGIVDLNYHIERNNWTLTNEQNKMIQNADQNHGPTGITCTNSHRPVSMSFDQVKLNKITKW